ncbi:MAG TPA: helix-hairpin-helix domain-containing protein [Acidobacteriota bacterium]|nr:helix-hairpin-helix domain-containing protein [Acidobacteriota bacterium]
MPGVGPTTAKRLLQQFGSLEGVREASDEALAAAVGPARAAKIRAALAAE